LKSAQVFRFVPAPPSRQTFSQRGMVRRPGPRRSTATRSRGRTTTPTCAAAATTACSRVTAGSSWTGTTCRPLYAIAMGAAGDVFRGPWCWMMDKWALNRLLRYLRQRWPEPAPRNGNG
jgi:hypothetical protein